MTRILLQLRALWLSVGTVSLLALSMHALGDDAYSAEWGPEIGSTMPPIASLDQAGVQRELADLVGEQGLLLFLNRSADW